MKILSNESKRKLIYLVRCAQAYDGNLVSGMKAVKLLERKLGVKRANNIGT